MKLKQKLLYQQHGLPVPKVHVDMKTNTYFLSLTLTNNLKKWKRNFIPYIHISNPTIEMLVYWEKIHIKDKVPILKVQLLGCNFI